MICKFKPFFFNRPNSFILCSLFLVFSTTTCSINKELKLNDTLITTASELKLQAKKEKSLSLFEEYPYKIKQNEPLYPNLLKRGVPSKDILAVVKVSKKIHDLSNLRPGIRFKYSFNDLGEFTEIGFLFSPLNKVNFFKNEKGEWQAHRIIETIDTRVVSFSGKIDSNLWESSKKSKVKPDLIFSMVEIFAWVFDFTREAKKGDTWRFAVEEKTVSGTHVGWGDILAAEYTNNGKVFTAALFRKGDQNIGYYDTKGNNLRKMLLKNPLKFARVTSGFSKRRFHPKLKVFRAHKGVDYGAPIGTPVRSVGDGVVTFMGRRGGGGLILKINHNTVFRTAYKHLNGFGKSLKVGSSVRQGQTVAYTGNTGLSTGPHLHYELYKNNRSVDPLNQMFPDAFPVSNGDRFAFKLQVEELMSLLPQEYKVTPLGAKYSWSKFLQKPIKDDLSFERALPQNFIQKSI